MEPWLDRWLAPDARPHTGLNCGTALNVIASVEVDQQGFLVGAPYRLTRNWLRVLRLQSPGGDLEAVVDGLAPAAVLPQWPGDPGRGNGPLRSVRSGRLSASWLGWRLPGLVE